jgi:hypothetical protein
MRSWIRKVVKVVLAVAEASPEAQLARLVQESRQREREAWTRLQALLLQQDRPSQLVLQPLTRQEAVRILTGSPKNIE